MTIFLYRQF